MLIYQRVTGWWFQHVSTPLKNDGVSNSWDDDIPNINGKIKPGPNHQPDKHV